MWTKIKSDDTVISKPMNYRSTLLQLIRVDQHKPHKLAPSWEGPFIVTKVLHNGAYRLYNVEHNIDEPRAWNAELLRPFYT